MTDNPAYQERRPRLLDLFCGAGGAAKGYQRAGFYVVGVDIEPQPNYCGDEFVQADAMTWLLDGFDAIHASPPCQDHTSLNGREQGNGWMLDATIDRLRPLTVPWVVENVVGPTVSMRGWWFVLCGSSFGLKVRRHRRFRSNCLLMPPACRHAEQGRPYTITGGGPAGSNRKATSVTAKHSLKPADRDFWRYLDMPWMEGAPSTSVAQAIPPAYTEWIGRQIIGAMAYDR